MKDWGALEADVVKLLNVHYTSGRSGRDVDFVVVHYNAGNLTIEGCWSVWQTREASAHYQVEDDGTIGQLVWDSNTAWHASNWDANCRSIGVEHANEPDGTITEECLDNGAHLVAALCKYFGLGRPQWLKNVFPHKHFADTSCPGQIYGSQKDAYIQRAQQWYDSMTGSGSAPSTGGGSSSSSSGGKEYAGTGFGGTYRCNCSTLNVRSAPSTSASVVAQYKSGQTVVLDDWYTIADGFVWGRYTGAYSGKKRYVAVGRATGKPEADDYLVRAGGSASSSSGSAGSSSGFIVVGSKVRVTNPYDENGTHLAVSGTYDVLEVSGDRVVIGRGGAVTAACPKSNLALA